MRGTYLAVLVLISMVAAACTSAATQSASEEPVSTAVATTTLAPVTTTVPAPEAATEPDYATAQETLDAWADAIGAGDVDAALATHRVEFEDLATDREAMGYLAVTISHAEFNDCEFSMRNDGRIVAECDLTLIDPILVATGMDTVGVSWQLSDDGTAILKSEPGYRLSPADRFASHSQEQYPEEFAEACGVGTVNYNALVGWAFNRACGVFTAEIAGEVVDAINETSYLVAQETLNAWAAAIAADDVDAALATHRVDPDHLLSERESMGYLAVTISEADFNDCRFSTVSSSSRIQAECDLTLMDPILVATDMETVSVSWQLSNDGREILVSEPGPRLTSTNLFVFYAQERYPGEFAEACGSGTVNYNSFVGWAFNRSCGEFTADIADEVVDAIIAAD